MSYSDHSLWEKEQAFIAEEKKRNPDAFSVDRVPRQFLLERIGITEKMPQVPKGYVKYSPLDFIVEEVLRNGTVVSADMKESGPDNDPELAGKGTIYVDIVKTGISTIDAINRIAAALSIEPAKIGYAGMKDEIAITAQRIGIEGSSLGAVKALSIPGVILKNIWEGGGKIKIGQLKGNRFSLFIRTERELEAEDLASRVKDISEKGVMNYYGLQRFGEPRFLSHLFGLCIFQGDMDGFLKAFLTEESPLEWPYVTELRRKSKRLFGDWKAIREAFSTMSYTFRIENVILDGLQNIKDPSDYYKVLLLVPKQADLWAKAYASYLTNCILSEAAGGMVKLGNKLPLVISRDPKVFSIYGSYLKKDGTAGFMQNLRMLSFINIAHSAYIHPIIRPEFHGFKATPEGVAISFDLVKGAYATTVLMSLFDIIEGAPIPEWVKDKEVDVKGVLNTGTIDEIKERLKVFIDKLHTARKEKTI